MYLAVMIDRLYHIIESKGLWSAANTYRKGELLSFADAVNTDLYYISKGAVCIYFLDGAEQRIMRFGYAGEIVAALDSFISDQPSQLYIQALTTTVVKKIDKKHYQSMLEEDAEAKAIWQELLIGLVYQQLEREQDLLMASPKDRYDRVLSRSPRLFQEVPRKYIANYLRMTPETLSRLRSK